MAFSIGGVGTRVATGLLFFFVKGLFFIDIFACCA
jgi:hypothetical protein